LEGLNSLIQATNRRAREYRTNRTFIAMNCLLVGKLNAGPMIVWPTKTDEEPLEAADRHHDACTRLALGDGCR
jgi:hypothetical protein